jgi:protein-S-isoprenylcysteine O-methyltransferase Ste14
MIVYYINVLYSIVVPLKLSSNAFYVGLVIYLVAFSLLVITSVNFGTSTKEQLVRKGMYRVSRNPMYFFTLLAYYAIGIASASWLILLLTVIFTVLQHRVILAEERICEEKYGQDYLDYKQNTPRYFLFR